MTRRRYNALGKKFQMYVYFLFHYESYLKSIYLFPVLLLPVYQSFICLNWKYFSQKNTSIAQQIVIHPYTPKQIFAEIWLFSVLFLSTLGLSIPNQTLYIQLSHSSLHFLTLSSIDNIKLWKRLLIFFVFYKYDDLPLICYIWA